jgi:hypothetical protein
MSIVPLNRDYNNDNINDYANVNGTHVEIFAGTRKGDPYGGETLFDGTMDQLRASAEYGSAAEIIENDAKPKAATPAPAAAPAAQRSSGSLRQDKGLDGDIYGGGNN